MTVQNLVIRSRKLVIRKRYGIWRAEPHLTLEDGRVIALEERLYGTWADALKYGCLYLEAIKTCHQRTSG